MLEVLKWVAYILSILIGFALGTVLLPNQKLANLRFFNLSLMKHHMKIFPVLGCVNAYILKQRSS